MSKPTSLPAWDTTKVNAIAPDATHEAQGWLAPGGVPEKPPFQTFNHWQNNVYDWTKYIVEEMGGYAPNHSAVDQGLTGNNDTVKYYVDSIGASQGTIVFRHDSSAATTTYTFSTDETIPANIAVIVENGAIISIANGKTLTISSIQDGTYQFFEWTGTGTIAGLKKTDFLRPEWFGAKGDYDVPGQTGTDDSAAFQKAIDVIVANNLTKLMLNQSNYYLASKVNLTGGSFLIKGPSGADREAGVTTASEQPAIYGAAGLACFFDIGNESTDALGGIEFNGVRFVGDTSGASAESAIKITSKYNGPFWPLVVQGCFFHDFNTAAIYANQAALTYNMAFASITKSAFQGCTYSILLDETNANRCYGLHFEDNRCHQGGAIKGSFGGNICIQSNNFEGQAEPITLLGVNVTVNATIENNYFEINTGDYIISVNSAGTVGSVRISNNFYTACTATTYIKVLRVSGEITDNVSTAVGMCNSGSIKVKNLVHLEGWGNSSQVYTSDYVSAQNLKDNITDSEPLFMTTFDGVVDTPFGSRAYDAKSAVGDSLIIYPHTDINVAVGDFVVCNVLVRYDEGTGDSYLKISDSGSVVKKSIYGGNSLSYEWTVHTFVWEADVIVTGARFEFFPYGTAAGGDGCDIVGGYAYIASSREIAPYIPYSPQSDPISKSADYTVRVDSHKKTFDNQGASGTVTLSLPAAVAGLEFSAIRVASQSFRLDPDGTEAIRGGAAGKYLELNTDGDSVTLKCFEAGKWEIVAGYGTYAYEV